MHTISCELIQKSPFMCSGGAEMIKYRKVLPVKFETSVNKFGIFSDFFFRFHGYTHTHTHTWDEKVSPRLTVSNLHVYFLEDHETDTSCVDWKSIICDHNTTVYMI